MTTNQDSSLYNEIRIDRVIYSIEPQRRMNLFVILLSLLVHLTCARALSVKQKLNEAMINPQIEQLYGLWYHPIMNVYVNITEADLVSGRDLEPHKLGACSNHVHCPDQVVGVVRAGSYYWILHQNGVIKSSPVDKSTFSQTTLVATESKGMQDFIQNLKHASENGCFCLLVMTDTHTIKRYNRWNDPDGYYFYTLTKSISERD